MKKVSLANPEAEVIRFLARGQRGSATAIELVIDAKGVIAQDNDAALAKERFGGNIIVSDIDAKEAAKTVTEALKPTADEIAAEEARRAALTEEERAAEDAAKAEAEAKASAAKTTSKAPKAPKAPKAKKTAK